jgi:hypothetical protein
MTVDWIKRRETKPETRSIFDTRVLASTRGVHTYIVLRQEAARGSAGDPIAHVGQTIITLEHEA